jgi:proline iminopeptidase
MKSEQRCNEEGTPLIHRIQRHLSLDNNDSKKSESSCNKRSTSRIYNLCFILLALVASLFLLRRPAAARNNILTIDHAVEDYLTLATTSTNKQQEHISYRLWYRTWGNRAAGIPVLFVHGGPGNAVSDYNNGNQRFFDANTYFVIEVDQRGTGKSQPSVREHYKNMKYYDDISIDQIVNDFEQLRQHLQLEKWLIFGGSFGSTLSLNYGTRYPQHCLALIVRGIYLDTVPEVQTVYARDTYVNHVQRLQEFDILYEYAANHVDDKVPLDPNDAERLMRVYANMITKGDKYAIWHWHVFENNLMETIPENLLDPNNITPEDFPEAQSIAFFETRLWLRGSYENPSNLMQRIDQLRRMPVWVCQGLRDEVCPPRYAHIFVDQLQQVNNRVTARFVDSGHEDTDPVMADCLEVSLKEFVASQALPSKGRSTRISL